MMDLLIAWAWSWLHAPYKWGGQTIDGIDCSGLVQEILAGAGEDPVGDQTAQGLYNHFSFNGTFLSKPQAGALSFYGKSRSSITHVGFLVDSLLMIEAGGGGKSTITRADAVRSNAFVRLRPYDHRSDIQAVIFPRYTFSGRR